MIDRRPVAYVALNGPVYDPDPDTLAAKLAKLFPGKPVRLSRLPDPKNEAGRLLLELNGAKLAVLSIAAPIPQETWAEATAGVTIWPEAARAFKLHRSHLIVAGIDVGDTHGDAAGAAVATTLLTAAFCDDHRAIAVYWDSSRVACPPQKLLEDAQAMLAKTDFSFVPTDLWVRLFFNKDSAGRIGAMTLGVAPFADREIVLAPMATTVIDVASRVIDLAAYLIRQGPVIADGDSVGRTEDERLRARYRTAPDGTPALEIVSD